MSEGVHLHVHSEESLLDGLSTVKQLVSKAKSLGQTALGITDHGVCGAIPDFITECEKQGIKPIPGSEAYLTKDRTKQSAELEQMRKDICIKYKITDKKGKPRMKVLRDFMRKVEKNYSCFEDEAHTILKDYFMSSEPEEESLDLFSAFEVIYENPSIPITTDDKLNEFKRDIFEYLDHGNFHMVLLAIDNKGLEDLYAIISDAHINGFYSDPRTDLSYIRENGLGKHIIATSACLGSFFSQLVLAGRKEEVIQHIEECKETFHSFYLEKQATHIPDQLIVNQVIDELAILTNTPKILTTDVHYANKEDNHIHDILVTSSIGKCINDEDRMQYAHEFWMKSDEEMMEKCNDPEAWANTLKIAEMVNVTLPEEPLLPKAIVKDGDTPEEVLKKNAWNGLFQLALKENIDINMYSRRLQKELDVIVPQGFADYFLVVSEYLSWAKDNGYPVGPGRGSAAGSLVAMCLRITSIDPIKYNLMFERFLSPDRISFPDIDSDLPIEGCLAVQQHLKDIYGEDRVAQIGTKGTLAARAVCRRVGKTLGYDLKLQDTFAKAIPSKPGVKLKEAYKDEEMVRQYAQAYPQWWEAMVALEGHQSQRGTHAGGIVLSPEPLTTVTPLRIDSDGLQTTQYDMNWIEKLLVKFDILKLDTMGLIKKTMEYAGIWEEVNIEDIDLNDSNLYDHIFNKLNLSGIFQFESDGMKNVIKELKPDNFEDMVAINALFRPGPMDNIPSFIKRKHGQEKVTYPFPELEPILKDTYGIYVYQEQLMVSSVLLGGLTQGQSDYIRAGVAKQKYDLMNRWLDLMIYGSEHYKKKQAEMVKQYPIGTFKDTKKFSDMKAAGIWVDYEYEEQPYVEGAINKGYDEEKLLKLKEDWITFGSYAFNRSHAVAYSKIACMCAYLKCYHPVEFMSALLTISEGKKDKQKNPKNVTYMQECDEMGIRILPPDVNKSLNGWTPKTYEQPIQENDTTYIGEIRYGLSSIAKVSGESVNEIINNRPYESVEDLVEKTNGTKVNKTKVEALIKSGSFDNINKNRNLLLRQYFEYRGEEFEHIPKTTTKATVLAYERDSFGTTISARSRWERITEGSSTQITGHVRAVEKWIAKSSGKEHYTVTVHTQEEPVLVTIWGYLMDRHANELIIGNKVTIKGEKSRDKLTAKNITCLENLGQYEVDLEPAY